MQQNTEWRNKLSKIQCGTVCHKEAYKKTATEAAAIKLEGKLVPWKAISNKYSKKYSLEGDGREGSREQFKVTVSTLKRKVASGDIGMSPAKKDPQPAIDCNYLGLVAIHASMQAWSRWRPKVN